MGLSVVNPQLQPSTRERAVLCKGKTALNGPSCSIGVTRNGSQRLFCLSYSFFFLIFVPVTTTRNGSQFFRLLSFLIEKKILSMCCR